MGRRTWIKIFLDKWLRGSIRQEKPEVRGIFVDLLSLAGDSAYGDDGIIKLAHNVGFTDQVLCGMLNIPIGQWKKTKIILAHQTNSDENRVKFISMKQGYAIQISNWSKYQGEYQRQKKYRRQTNVISKDEIEIITEEIQYSYDGHRAKRKADPACKINDAMKSAIYDALKNKKAGRKWEEIVNYTLAELMTHLESKFRKGMCFDNYGEVWHMDHVIPKSKFSFGSINDSQFKLCWALENLQPLFKSENLTKRDKVTGQVTKKVTSQVTEKVISKKEKEKEKENNTTKILSPLDEIMDKYQNKFPEVRKLYGLGGIVRARDYFEGCHDIAWTYESILDAIEKAKVSQPWKIITISDKNSKAYAKEWEDMVKEKEQ